MPLTYRARNRCKTTRKQIAGARLLRELPEYISHEKYISDNLGIYFNDELLHKKKKEDLAVRDRAAAISSLLARGIKTPPAKFVDFKKRPEYISDAEYQAGFDEKYYYTEETYHQKKNSENGNTVAGEPVKVSSLHPPWEDEPVKVSSLHPPWEDAPELEPAINSKVKAIIDPLMKIPMNKRTDGKYIFDVFNTYYLSSKEKYDTIKILLDNNFSPDYIIPESGQSGLLWYIIHTLDLESEQIPILLLEANVRFGPSPPENLLIISITKHHELIPRKLIENGYTPNSLEMKQLGKLLKNRPELLSPQNREFLIYYFRTRGPTLLAALRSKKQLNSKRLTGDSAPKTAYVIMGHGGEILDDKNMPEGCVLVTQVHSGEINYVGGSNIYTCMFNYPAAAKSRFLDPITNYEDISDTINIGRGTLHFDYTPLAVYRTGNSYPEFTYTLLSYWDSDRPDDAKFVGQPNSYKICDSGLAQYPFIEGPKVCVVFEKNSIDYEPLIEAFRRSVYPTSAEIRAFIEAMPNPKTMGTIIPSLLTSPLIKISQTQLFTKYGAGVYYNLVCRFTDTPYLLEKNTSGKKVISNTGRQLTNLSHKVRHNRPEILQAIIEAEVERKDLIDRLHLNETDTSVWQNIIIQKLSNIEDAIASGNRDPHLPYLKYFYSKKYYKDLLNHYRTLRDEYGEFNHAGVQFYESKIADLKRTVATPQYLPESALGLPHREIKEPERERQRIQRAAHNQWVAAHPNNNNNSGVQRPENFEARATNAELEARRKVSAWRKQ